MARAAVVNLTEDQYTKVKAHLDNKGTKKAACEMLGISYNTKKLQELMERYELRDEAAKAARAAKRKQPVTQQEVVWWITAYLQGNPVSEIAESHFRSEAVIKLHLEKHGALLRHARVDRLNPPLIPEQCISDEFQIGEYVWAAAYNCVAEVRGFYKDAVRIHVLSPDVQEFSYQPSYNLGSLRHLKELGVDLNAFTSYIRGPEVIEAVNEAVRNANKRAGKE